MSPPSQTPPCRFPAAGSSSRTLWVRPGMSNLRRHQRIPAKELVISLPRQPVPSRAAIEPLPPDPYDAPIELEKALRVCRSAVVLVVASELGVEGLLPLVHRGMPVLLAPCGDRRETPPEPLAHRSHMHGELPSPAACANVRQPEEVEGAGFLLSLLLRASLRVTPKSHVPRLVRLKHQTVFCESLRYDILHLLCVFPVVEAEYGVIGETNLVSFTPESRLHHLLEPFVEQVVQVDVGQERTNRLSLPRPLVTREKLSLVDDSHLNPLPYQAKHASIADTFLDQLHELLSHDRIKVGGDV